MANSNSARLKTVALPAEHGSWGLVLEPIALGLLLAFSWAGAFLALSAFFAFLSYQPLRILLKNFRQKKHSPRTFLAKRFVYLYGASALLFLLASLLNSGWGPLLPTLIASPLLLVFIGYDLEGPKRSWQAEISATLFFSSIAAAILLAADWALSNALALWAVMAARGLPSVLYIRARLRLDKEKGKPSAALGVVAVHTLALALVFVLVRWNLLPVLAIAALLLLLLRAGFGLSRYRRPVKVRSIGFMEIAWGAITVLAVSIGTLYGL